MRLCHICKIDEVMLNSSKCRPRYNEYMRGYMAARYAARRQMALDFLGNACVVCGSIKDLQIDHIDRSTKAIAIAKLILAKDEKLFAELVKCQALCPEHHGKKTSQEMGVPHGGGVKGKRNCPCELCREAARRYNRGFHAARRAARPA
jgi:5-methylcytosine-specific restriction endonuclease McrA